MTVSMDLYSVMKRQKDARSSLVYFMFFGSSSVVGGRYMRKRPIRQVRHTVFAADRDVDSDVPGQTGSPEITAA